METGVQMPCGTKCPSYWIDSLQVPKEMVRKLIKKAGNSRGHSRMFKDHTYKSEDDQLECVSAIDHMI